MNEGKIITFSSILIFLITFGTLVVVTLAIWLLPDLGNTTNLALVFYLPAGFSYIVIKKRLDKYTGNQMLLAKKAPIFFLVALFLGYIAFFPIYNQISNQLTHSIADSAGSE